MAAGGILIAVILGMISGIWVGAGLPGNRAVYSFLAGVRSFPDLTLAILCVVVIGIGPAAGMIAIAIFYGAAIGKIFSDLFRSADPGPTHALRATGASRLSVALFGLLPLRSKDVLSYGTYEFESALRCSVIVGAVGGGGIGTELVGTINALDFHRATTIILLLIALIGVIDACARWIKRIPGLLFLVFPLAAIAFWQDRPTMLAFMHSVSTFAGMLPPSLAAGCRDEAAEALARDCRNRSWAELSSRCSGRCLWDWPRRGTSFRLGFRCRCAGCWKLCALFPKWCGDWCWWGPSARARRPASSRWRCMALDRSAGSTRNRSRTFAPNPSARSRPPAQGLSPSRASAFFRLAIATLSVHTLFRLEWNVRAATIVGVIGAGGIGQALYNAQQLFFYQQMMAYILITGVIVGLVDFASSRLRQEMGLMERYA